MRFNFPLLFILLSLSIPSLGETMDDLVTRESLYYKKFTDVPFTGEVEGKEQGSFKDGKRDGRWRWYHDNGQLKDKLEYKEGKQEGRWVGYHKNGQLEFEGEYKDGKPEGPWVGYHEDGSINEDITGTYKNGEKISD